MHPYERLGEASEYTHVRPEGAHAMRRGFSRTAGNVMRSIVATDGRAQTVHDFASSTDAEHLPASVARLLFERRVPTVQMRRAEYRD
ncbi:hypothetical protein [Mycobacterium asiaticum]|uniref:hypothetical protein n=1 Tax=Mycobacterium asiaticum TaxID=1790 RepID=UPI000561D465|nr:hypothetical protein [Mycobacterium asiaticum]ORA10902.1 hypothetical protein BST16_20720 [Mycobacterium asiaticum DSM 44297]